MEIAGECFSFVEFGLYLLKCPFFFRRIIEVESIIFKWTWKMLLETNIPV